jgi:hypothetical protein
MKRYRVVIKGTYAKEFLHEKGGICMVNRCNYVFKQEMQLCCSYNIVNIAFATQQI